MTMLQAYKNNVIAISVEIKKKEPGFILMPEHKAKHYEVARIVSVGRDTVDLKEGDLILYRPYSAVKVEFQDKEYLLMENSGVLAIVNL